MRTSYLLIHQTNLYQFIENQIQNLDIFGLISTWKSFLFLNSLCLEAKIKDPNIIQNGSTNQTRTKKQQKDQHGYGGLSNFGQRELTTFG